MSEKNEEIAKKVIFDEGSLTLDQSKNLRLHIEEALDSKDSESAHLRREFERQAKYALEHGLDSISHATVLKTESAQLREELSWYKTVREPDLEKMFNDATRDNDYQSLLIEKLRSALYAQRIFWKGIIVMRDMAQCRICGATVTSGSFKSACEKCAMKLGLEALALLHQDEKKEGQ